MATKKTLVTYLEMLHRRAPNLADLPTGFVLQHIDKIDVDEYIALYNQVGSQYYWTSRILISKADLLSIIHHPHVKIFVLFENNKPIGFFELNSKNAPRSVEISFIGLIPEAVGRGVGKQLAQHAINYAWAQNPGRIIIQTCTLDHKNALPLYQKLGFTAYNRHVTEFQVLDEA